jgi:hypothetical protein
VEASKENNSIELDQVANSEDYDVNP